jgi:hypothetical protein
MLLALIALHLVIGSALIWKPFRINSTVFSNVVPFIIVSINIMYIILTGWNYLLIAPTMFGIFYIQAKMAKNKIFQRITNTVNSINKEIECIH